MADPAAAIDPHMPAGLLRHAIAHANGRPAARRVRARRLVIANDSAVLLISIAGSVVIYAFADPSGTDDPAFALLAFLLFVLGAWLALLAFVTDQFPRAARVGEAIARALRDYLLGGRN
ncbi:uncharacterized protein LOC133930435 [Phragmites australis]|uniref:uncharacterized protein LOC133930435 n=1 Tax=Phragmites australis TaxID=29695 RepID=UPI002D792EBB|nr:uncharacterized protein LOC133930435 [Phragmites australis]